MKRAIWIGCITLPVLFGSAAQAEVNVRLRAGYAVSGDYSVTNEYFGAPLKYDAEYEAIPVGATLLFGSMYVDLAYQASTGDASFDWAPNQSLDFSRDETTITFGMRQKNFSGYVGYKIANTETVWPQPDAPDKFETSGLVLGFGYVIPISKSAISLSVGTGVLTGKYTYDGGSTANDTSDATVGLSLGVGYTYSFNKHFSLAADYKWNSYNYEWTDANIKEELKQATITAAVTF